MKSKSFFLLIIILIFLITGCWDKREIEILAAAEGISIDRVVINGKKMYRISEHIIIPRKYGSGDQGTGGGKEQAYVLATSIGSSVEEANLNLATRVPRMPYLAHSRFVILGEEICKEGISEVLDFLTRQREIRMRNYIVVTHGEASKNFLVQPEIERGLATEVFGILTFSQGVNPKIYPITLRQFLSRVLTPGEMPGRLFLK